METFRFRLNCIDHYQATPTDLDPLLRRGTRRKSHHHAPPVPVIRVFGATDSGQKVCAHIHGALPYLYLEYNGSLKKEDVDAYILSLRGSIDHALAAAYRRNIYDGKSVYVGHITIVKGVPFYGYNVGYKFFLKVYLLNPMHMTRFADLLQQGAILNRVFQPYESHLQYLLQWMCDYNLYGCSYIDCSKVQFRNPVPNSHEVDVSVHKWHSDSIPLQLVSSSDQYPRQSHCSLEIDVRVEDILNRHELHSRPIHHDFMERSNLLHPEDKFVPSMAGLWKDETRRRKLRMGITNPSSSPFPPEVLVSMSADSRIDKGDWIHEEEYREIMVKLIVEERGVDSKPSFDTFVKQVEGSELVQTAVQSVEDLYYENLQHQSLSEEPRMEDDEPLLDEDQHLPANLVHPSLEDRGLEAVDEGDEIDADITPRADDLDPLSVCEAQLRNSQINDPSNDRTTSDEDSNTSSSTSRRLPTLDELDISRKHSLNIPQLSSAKRPRVHYEKGEHVDPRGTNQTDGEHSNPSQLSQASIKAHGISNPTTLAFPVVKNPNAPETLLRLSQTAYSNSQETPKTPAIKNLAMQPQETSPLTPWSHGKSLTPPKSATNRPGTSAGARAMVSRLTHSFRLSSRAFYYGNLPPSADLVESTMVHYGLPEVIHQDAFYGNENDVPDRPREYAGREFRLQSTTLPYLPDSDFTGTSIANMGLHPRILRNRPKEHLSNSERSRHCSLRHWEIATSPPTYVAVENWVRALSAQSSNKHVPIPENKHKPFSQIEGPTQKNEHGFKYSQKQTSTSVQHETQYMSIMSLEVHANSRGSLVPDPAEDEIQCIFWCIEGEEGSTTHNPRTGLICLSDDSGLADRISKQVSIEVEYEQDELEVINRVVNVVRQFDPDILTGYEVHNGSWGYLIERARMKYEYDLCDEISRMKSQSHGRFGKEADRWGFTNTSTIRITGRHMINIWRAMRGELNLLQYTMENVVFHLLHKRIPHYSHADLTSWYSSSKPRDLSKVLNYFISRVQLNIDILEANEIVPRTSEQARLLGVDFFSVISRGSQFKVESTMFRIAKPENFILVSPSRKQVGQQNALECLPLVMEPQSDFYSSPLLVLDFQSLYPSVMIAYNYCYSTCLGRIVNWRGRNKMGFMDFEREPQLLELVKDHVNIAPNGMMYVRPEMRKSLLAKMLGEILETRVMVKSGMKTDKDDKTLQQLLNNRQLVLCAIQIYQFIRDIRSRSTQRSVFIAL